MSERKRGVELTLVQDRHRKGYGDASLRNLVAVYVHGPAHYPQVVDVGELKQALEAVLKGPTDVKPGEVMPTAIVCAREVSK